MSLGTRQILKKVSLEAGPGVTAIIGPNGSGKTTLLRTIAGLVPAVSGHLEIDGRSVLGMSLRKRSQEVAYSPQEWPSGPDFTVRHTVLLGRTPSLGWAGRPQRRDLEAADLAMRKLGIHALAERPLSELSGGERRLVVLAMCVCRDAGVILLDEPTTFLDAAHAAMLLRHVRTLGVEQGKTIVIALHDVNQVISCASNVLLLHDDGAFASGSVAHMVTSTALTELFGVDFVVARSGGTLYAAPLYGGP